MPILNTKTPRRYSPSAEAAYKEQKRIAHLENEERNQELPVFMFRGYGFRPVYTVRGGLNMEGPLCPRKRGTDRDYCYNELKAESFEATTARCEVCDVQHDLHMPHQRLRELAHQDYLGYRRFLESQGKVVTLDVPFDATTEESTEGPRKVTVKWSQKDGRNMAVVQFLWRDGTGKKAQVFVDMDRQEIRHDAGDLNPGVVLAELRAIFKNTDLNVQYKQDDKETL